eukprot:3480675-Pyramimonas_sp.AAC.1
MVAASTLISVRENPFMSSEVMKVPGQQPIVNPSQSIVNPSQSIVNQQPHVASYSSTPFATSGDTAVGTGTEAM